MIRQGILNTTGDKMKWGKLLLVHLTCTTLIPSCEFIHHCINKGQALIQSPICFRKRRLIINFCCWNPKQFIDKIISNLEKIHLGLKKQIFFFFFVDSQTLDSVKGKHMCTLIKNTTELGFKIFSVAFIWTRILENFVISKYPLNINSSWVWMQHNSHYQ